MKIAVLFFLFALVLGCSPRPKPVGLRSWDDVQRIADGMMLRAEFAPFLQSTDLSGISRDITNQLEEFRARWKKASIRSFYIETRVFSVDEHMAFIAEARKGWPLEMRSYDYRWNTRPDKIIVYRFDTRDPKNVSRADMCVGVFQRGGLWYFCGNY